MSNNLKMVQHRPTAIAYLQWPTNRKSMIYRTVPFSMTLNDPYPQFQRQAMLNISETGRHTENVIEILIGIYTRPTQQCYFVFRMTLSDLAK